MAPEATLRLLPVTLSLPVTPPATRGRAIPLKDILRVWQQFVVANLTKIISLPVKFPLRSRLHGLHRWPMTWLHLTSLCRKVTWMVSPSTSTTSNTTGGAMEFLQSLIPLRPRAFLLLLKMIPSRSLITRTALTRLSPQSFPLVTSRIWPTNCSNVRTWWRRFSLATLKTLIRVVFDAFWYIASLIDAHVLVSLENPYCVLNSFEPCCWQPASGRSKVFCFTDSSTFNLID